MKKKLTNSDFCRSAKKLKCDVAAIKAVATVESRGNGFYADGFPVILFERHKFYKYAKASVKKDWKLYPDICNPSRGGYGKAGQNQRNKFNKAFVLDPIAAMKSCSWGKFQIMGFNHVVCGYRTVGEFVDAMKESEGRHLDAFVNFVIGNKLDKHLRSLNWAAFANGYNGPDYKANKYDTKMSTEYTKFLKEKINCSNVPEAVEDIKEQIVEEVPAEMISVPNETIPVTQVVAERDAESKAESVADTQVSGIQASTAGAVTFVTTALGGLVTFLAGHGWEIIFGIALFGAVFVIARFWFANREKERIIAENKTKLDGEIQLKLQREAQAFELQKLTLQSAMQKDLNSVTIVPPPSTIENSDAESEVAL